MLPGPRAAADGGPGEDRSPEQGALPPRGLLGNAWGTGSVGPGFHSSPSPRFFPARQREVMGQDRGEEQSGNSL